MVGKRLSFQEENQPTASLICDSQSSNISAIATTLYHVLGINLFQDYHDRQGRTLKMLDEGEVIRELIS